MSEEILERCSDIHILTSEDEKNQLRIESVLVFPGPEVISREHYADLFSLIESKVLFIRRKEFSVQLGNYTFRGQFSDRAIDGIWYRLRKMINVAPSLETLPSRLPEPIENVLLHPSLNRGGLILVSGAPGSGKTTVSSAILVSRLTKFGGFAYTIEDPPEIVALNGPHGEGYCCQTMVYETEDGWEQSIKEVLRSQPVGSNLILFVGEIRTVEAARMVIRAASNGFLVITTTFATDILSGIDTFYQMLGEEFLLSFSSVLRVVLYLRMTASAGKRMIDPLILMSDGASSRVALAIRNRQFGQLKDELAYQTNLFRGVKNHAKAV